jgi:hypothetical protein
MARSVKILFLFSRKVSHVGRKKNSDYTELIVGTHRIENLM